MSLVSIYCTGCGYRRSPTVRAAAVTLPRCRQGRYFEKKKNLILAFILSFGAVFVPCASESIIANNISLRAGKNSLFCVCIIIRNVKFPCNFRERTTLADLLSAASTEDVVGTTEGWTD